jgi:hypothetical protein
LITINGLIGLFLAVLAHLCMLCGAWGLTEKVLGWALEMRLKRLKLKDEYRLFKIWMQVHQNPEK